MSSLSWNDAITEAENDKKRTENLFIPQEGKGSQEIYVYPDEIKKADEKTRAGTFTFYHIKVKQGEKDKIWKVFLSDVGEIGKALKKHPNRVISVERVSGSKKLIIG